MIRLLNVKLLLGLLLALVLVGVGAHWVHGIREQHTTEALLREADRCDRQGERREQVEYLGRYLAFRPNDLEVLERYGLALAEIATTDQSRQHALTVLERVLRHHDGDEIRRRLVDLAMAPGLGRTKDAKTHLVTLLLAHSAGQTPGAGAGQHLEDQLLEFAGGEFPLEPTPTLVRLLAHPDPELEVNLGRCLEEQGRTGRPEGAEECYRKASACYRLALTQAPDRINVYVQLAALHRGLLDEPAVADRVMDAHVTRDGLVAKNPNSYRAWLARAQYRKDANLPGASEDVARARQLAPDEADVIVAASDLAQERGDAAEARSLLQRGESLHPRDRRIYERLAAMETREGRLDEAVAVLKRGEKLLPDELNLQWNLADLLISTGSSEAVEVVARLRQQTRSFQPIVDYLEARLLANQRKYAEALARLEKARARLANADDGKGLTIRADLLLAQCHERLGNPERQLAALRRALSLEPNLAPAQLAQAAALRSLGRSEEALDLLRKLAPKVPEAKIEFARLLHTQTLNASDERHRWAEVDQALDQAATEPTTDSVEVALLRAEGLAARRQLGQARECLEQIRVQQPKRVEPWIALANLAGREGHPEHLLTVLDEAERTLGDRVEIRLARASHWGHRGGKDAGDALEKLAGALGSFTEDDQVRLEEGLAQAFAQIGHDRRAEELWTHVAQQRPDDLRPALQLFELALRTGGQGEQPALARAVARLRSVEGDAGVHWRFAEASRLARLDGPKPIEQARLLLAEAAQRRPDWSQIPLLEGAIAERQGRPDLAAEAYLRALDRGDRTPTVIRHTLELLNGQRRFTEAERVVQKLAEQGRPTGITGQLAAEQALRRGGRNEALALASRAVSPQSRDYRDHLWRGRIFWSLGERAKAEAALRHALELAESAPETWIAWVEYLARTEQKAEAETAIEQAGRKIVPELAQLALAQCYLVVGQPERAEEQYQAAVTTRPSDPATLRIVADFYLRTGQAPKADPYLRRLLDPRIHASESLISWARRSRALGLALQGGYLSIREGLSLIEANLQTRDTVEDQRAKALLLAKVPGSLGDAIRTLESLERRQPPTPDEKFVLAQLLESNGEGNRARSLMRSLLATEGTNPVYLASFARSLLRYDQSDEARHWIHRLETLKADHPQTIELKARLLVASGQASEAVAQLQNYVKTRDVYRETFAALLEELGQLDAAEAMFRDSVTHSQRPEAVLILAEYLGRQGRLPEALELCDQAWSSCNPEAVSRTSLRLLYMGQADEPQRQQVASRLEEAIQTHPDSIGLEFDLANLESARGNYKQAEKLYQRVHERNRSNDAPLNNLAWLLAAADGEGAKALAVIGQAIALSGPTPTLLDTRAIAHLAMARSDLAIRDLENAIAAKPTPVMFLHLAQARLHAKDRQGANTAIQRANAAGLQAERLHPLDRRAYDQVVADLSRKAPSEDRRRLTRSPGT